MSVISHIIRSISYISLIISFLIMEIILKMKKVVDYISRSNVIRKLLFVTDAMEQIIIGLRANGFSPFNSHHTSTFTKQACCSLFDERKPCR
jgi:hypothetical protein